MFKVPNLRHSLDEDMLMRLKVVRPALIWNRVIDRYFWRDI